MLGDDLLACLLGDVYTDVEKTMIELQRTALVHETRGAFQRAMERRFTADVERLTGRRVRNSSRRTTSDPIWNSNCSCSITKAALASRRWIAGVQRLPCGVGQA
jgi:Na+-translocating membrane potential-generating system (MpsC)